MRFVEKPYLKKQTNKQDILIIFIVFNNSIFNCCIFFFYLFMGSKVHLTRLSCYDAYLSALCLNEVY